MRSCLECRLFPKCRDPNKAASYSCKDFRRYKGVTAGSILEVMLGEEEEALILPHASVDPDAIVVDPGKELDIMDMVQDAIDNPNPIPRDLKIDDRDLKEFPNFYEWCMSTEGANQPPFARQLAIGIHLFAEWCPRCSHPRFHSIYTVPYKATPEKVAENAVFLRHGVCPKCKARKSELIQSGELPLYQEFAGCIGQRGGKSATFSLLAPYVIHKYLKLQNPTRVLGLMEHSTISATFVGLTFARAVALLWSPVHNLITRSGWYRGYHEMLDYYSDKYGEENLYQLKETFISYRHRSMFLYPLGPNKRTLRGDCVTGGTIVNTGVGFVHMDELITSDGMVPCNMEISSPAGTREVSHTLKTQRETLRVTTRNGFEIQGTPEHPMLVLTPSLTYKWKALSQLVVGDFIVSRTAKTRPLFGSNRVPMPMATLAGYYTANGYHNEVSSDNPSVIRRLRSAASSMGIKVVTSSGTEGVRAATHYLSTNGRGKKTSFLKNYMQLLGCSPTSSYDKEIPYGIRTAPREVLHEFLEAYFECDSGVNGGTRNTGLEVELTTASVKLSQQIQVILLEVYGIVGRRLSVTSPITSRLRVGDDTPHTYWVTSITGYDAVLFLRSFKRAKVQKHRARFSKSVCAGIGSDRRMVPHVRKTLSELYEGSRLKERGKKLRRLVLANGNVVLNNRKPPFFSTVKSCVSGSKSHAPEGLVYGTNRSTLSRICSLNPEIGERFKRIVSLRGHYEEVISVTAGETVDVYDVTVPDGHIFTANGLASHNTRFLGATDELGWFFNGGRDDDEERERASGKEVHGALDRSLKTVRTKVRRLYERGYDSILSGYNISISSPSHATDMIVSLVNKFEDSREVLAIRLPTWKFNPDFNGREDFKVEYQDDPIRAERDFGASPALVNNPFFAEESYETIASACTLPSRVKYDYVTAKRDNRHKLDKWARIVSMMAAPTQHRSVMTLDAGYSDNSFGLSIVSRKDASKRVKVEVLLEIAPDKGETVLNHGKIYREVISPLIKEFNVGMLVTDRWQNIKLLDDAAEDHQIITLSYSLRYADFTDYRSYMLEGAIELPQLEIPKLTLVRLKRMAQESYPHGFRGKPVAHLVYQHLTVKDLGRTVDKGDDLTDDLFRALVLGTSHVLDDKLWERHLQSHKRNTKVAIGVLAGTGNSNVLHTGEARTSVGAISGASGGSSITSMNNGVNVGAVVSRR